MKSQDFRFRAGLRSLPGLSRRVLPALSLLLCPLWGGVSLASAAEHGATAAEQGSLPGVPVIEIGAPDASLPPLDVSRPIAFVALAPGAELRLLRLECRADESYGRRKGFDDVYVITARLALVNGTERPIEVDYEETVLGSGAPVPVVRCAVSGEPLPEEPSPTGGQCRPMEVRIAPGAAFTKLWMRTMVLRLPDLSEPCVVELSGSVRLDGKVYRYAFRHEFVPKEILVEPAPPLLSPQEEALHEAAEVGDAAELRRLLEAGTAMKADGSGETPLGAAARRGQAECVRLLLEAGAKDEAAPEALSAGHAAAMNGHREVLRLLLEAGVARPDLFSAVYDEGSETMRRLLADGADVRVRESLRGWTPLHLAARQGRADLVELLAEAGADVHAEDPAGQTPLFPACGCGRREAAAALIHRGAEVNTADEQGASPLLLAVCNRDAALAALLIEAGADVNFRPEEDEAFDVISPLHVAAALGSPELVELLLRAGADVRATYLADTPLHLAVVCGCEDEDEAVLESIAALMPDLPPGEDVRVRFPRPDAESRLRVVRALLNAGADPNARGGIDGDETPLDWAKAAEAAGQSGMGDVLRLLRRAGGKD